MTPQPPRVITSVLGLCSAAASGGDANRRRRQVRGGIDTNRWKPLQTARPRRIGARVPRARLALGAAVRLATRTGFSIVAFGPYTRGASYWPLHVALVMLLSMRLASTAGIHYDFEQQLACVHG